MTGKQLKNSILQLAIQGKLVPQDPHDEPASELLKRIRKEKEQLVKTSKLKKKDLESTPITEDEKPFEIPESWEWCRLKTILKQTNAGKSPDCLNRAKQEDEWGVIKTTAVQDCFFKGDENKVLPQNFTIQPEHIVQIDDLLITRAGPRNRTGIVCVVNYNCDKLILSDKTVRLDYLRGYTNPYYVMYCLNAPTIHDMIIDAMVGMASSQVNISQDSMKEFLIPLPPLSEQHRIVEKIEELMPFVEEYDKAQSELDKLNESLPEQLKKSILQQAIMGKLVPQDPNDEPASELLKRIHKEKENLVKSGALKKKDLITSPISDDEKPFDIPESWEWVHLGDIFAHTNGKQLNRADTKGKYHNYITTSNLYWDRFDLKEVRQMLFTDDELIRCTATKGDLLVCEGGDVGRSAIWTEDYDICIQNHIHRVRAYFPLCTRYFLYLLMLNKSIGLIGGKGIGIQGFSAKALHNTLVALPPLSEQHRIVAKIEELFSILK